MSDRNTSFDLKSGVSTKKPPLSRRPTTINGYNLSLYDENTSFVQRNHSSYGNTTISFTGNNTNG